MGAGSSRSMFYKMDKAIREGDIETVRKLCGKEINKSTSTKYGYVLLHNAILFDKFDILRLLIDKGASVNATGTNGETVLMYPKNAEITRLLIDNGAKVNAATDDDKTSLMNASEYGKLDVVRVLLENGAKVNAKNKNNETALYLAMYRTNFDIVRLLIENGADVNCHSNRNKGRSALVLAVYYAPLDIIRLLIENGVKVNTTETDGTTPLMVASQVKDLEYARLLLDAGADVNAVKPDNGMTPLMYASALGNLGVLRELAERGANMNAEDKYGKTAEAFANKEEIIQFFKDFSFKRLKNSGQLWKGFTQSDIKKLDDIFGEKAIDYSTCPVCLEYAYRWAGCMYMYHNCSKGKYYHRGLYDMYKSVDGNIYWCTICGRICHGHRHYQLTRIGEKKSELQTGENFFSADCTSQGGGGADEKLARFRRLREYALELEDDIDKKDRFRVMDELVEEVWNAPLRREKKVLSKIKNEKKWNIALNKFRVNASGPEKNEEVNAPNIPFEGELPLQKKGFNNVSLEDDVDLLVFRHRQKNGSTKEHVITEDGLKDFIKTMNKEFGTDNFGYCFNNQCDAKLHPGEIKDHVSETVYTEYKKKFNRKMMRQGGGGGIFMEATDAKCVLPKKGGATKRIKRGGRRTRRV